MEKWKKRTVELLASLAFGGRKSVGVVPSYPQKTRVGERDEAYFERTLPEKQGISSLRIYNMLCELERERRANLHSLLVLCDGRVICECSAPGYSGLEWHISHSMAKTVVGMVIGRLCDGGVLKTDMRLVDIFPEKQYRDKRFSLITVDHLLSMTAGVDFAEVGSVTESDWTDAFFSSAIRYAPGSKFFYNSMNSYMLVRIAERVSGKSFTSLAEDYIFAPLGIENYLWELGPEGSEKGGWGLYMSPESWAKVGCMLACGGEFMGRRVLSDSWVKTSTALHASVTDENGGFDYGYHLWIGRKDGELLLSGMLGQSVWICPKNKIVAVVTCGNNELFTESPTLSIIRRHLGVDMADKPDNRGIKLLEEKKRGFFTCRRWARPMRRAGGLLCRLGIRPREPFDERWNAVLGRYSVVANGSGFQPLILRLMQNNLDTVIEKIELFRSGNGLFMRVFESPDEHLIPIGLYGHEESLVTAGGEVYRTRAIGEVMSDRAGGVEYRIEIIFPETASTRMMVITPDGKAKIRIKMSERPNHRVAERLLDRYRSSGGAIAFALDLLERRLGAGEIERGIRRTFNPTLIGIREGSRGWEKMLKTENEIATRESGTVRLIRAIVDRFFSERKDDKQK